MKRLTGESLPRPHATIQRMNLPIVHIRFFFDSADRPILVHQPFHQGIAGARSGAGYKAFCDNDLRQHLTRCTSTKKREGWCTKSDWCLKSGSVVCLVCLIGINEKLHSSRILGIDEE
jgi:hypothetical protein